MSPRIAKWNGALLALSFLFGCGKSEPTNSVPQVPNLYTLEQAKKLKPSKVESVTVRFPGEDGFTSATVKKATEVKKIKDAFLESIADPKLGGQTTERVSEAGINVYFNVKGTEGFDFKILDDSFIDEMWGAKVAKIIDALRKKATLEKE